LPCYNAQAEENSYPDPDIKRCSYFAYPVGGRFAHVGPLGYQFDNYADR